MEETIKPKSVKTVGILVIIFSGLTLFSNTMGAISFLLVGGNDVTINRPNGTVQNDDPINFIFDNYVAFCLIMISIALGYLIGGIFIQKFKAWANRLLSMSASLSLVIIWGLMILMAQSIGQANGGSGFAIIPIVIGIIWSTPVALLIWFLNKQNIKKHFSLRE